MSVLGMPARWQFYEAQATQREINYVITANRFTMSAPQAFQHPIEVLPADIDAMNHVNNVVYLRYAQEVAEAHWLTKGSEDLRQQYAWVVLRHEIDYLSPSLLGHQLTGRTWVEEPAGPRIIRHVELFNETIQKVTAKVRTTWCLVDAATHRPKRIDETMIYVFR